MQTLMSPLLEPNVSNMNETHNTFSTVQFPESLTLVIFLLELFYALPQKVAIEFLA